MCALLIQTTNSFSIHSVEYWFRLAPPKKRKQHWKDGRSAKELAKAWFRMGDPNVPEEIEALFKSHPLTNNLVIEEGIPEVVTKLDEFRGGHRNHDMILLGKTGKNCTLVGIEAKADEGFGKVIQDKMVEGSKNPHSNVPNRIKCLSNSVFGRPIDEELGKLRYQLLYAFAGTLIEAKKRNKTQAVFVIYEFVSSKLDQKKVKENDDDFKSFIKTFPELKGASIEAGKLFGPIQVPGGKFVPGDIPVLIGKVTTNIKNQ